MGESQMQNGNSEVDKVYCVTYMIINTSVNEGQGTMPTFEQLLRSKSIIKDRIQGQIGAQSAPRAHHSFT